MISAVKLLAVAAALGAALTACAAARADAPDLRQPRPGMWRAWIETPGGPLPFGLEITPKPDGGLSAFMINGPERLEFPIVQCADGQLTLRVDYYDSTITARVVDDGAALEGEWSKRRSRDEVATIPFFARADQALRFDQIKPLRGVATASSEQIGGRWRSTFAKDTDGAIGEFRIDDDGRALATFLTPTGDYRYLEGVFDGSRLRLSCFDGAHAFLFDASVQMNNGAVSLKGDFYSGAHWHDAWTAVRDPDASLPDAFTQTAPTPNASLSTISFPDLDGRMRALDDPAFAGRARIIEVFGTWCPNCYDATHLLKELHAKYSARGLAILGLAFEVTGDPERDSRQVRTYTDRMAIPWPILLAGRANKEEASRALPIIDRLRSYPTFIFVDGAGRIRAVCTGFSGPATGEEHRKLRDRFEKLIESMLAEAN